MHRKYVGFFLGIILFLGIFLFTDLEPGKPEVTATLAVAVLMAVWLVSEAIPLAVTALLPLVAERMGSVRAGNLSQTRRPAQSASRRSASASPSQAWRNSVSA